MGMLRRCARLCRVAIFALALLVGVLSARSASAAIAFNSSFAGGLDANPVSYTVGSGTNRILFVGLFMDGTDGGPSVTVGGVSMTLITTIAGSDRAISLFYLLNPASGAQNIAVSFVTTPAHFALEGADYSGVLQSGQPDGFATANPQGATSMTATVTVTHTGCWLFALAREQVGGPVTWTAGTTSERQDPGNGLHLADSNGTVSTGSIADTVTMGSANLVRMIAASFQPDTGGGGGTTPRPLTLLGVGD